MNDYPTKREFTRVNTIIEARVTAGDTVVQSARTRDISMNGLFVETNERLEPGIPCEIVLFLGRSASDYRIEAHGKIVRSDDSGIAVEFTDIVGVDSYDHLRNLVLYNSSNTEQVEEELRTHLGIRRRTQS